MAASSADIRDILSLPGPSATPAAAPPRKPPKAQKPEGISRELYSLIGDHAPALVAIQRPKPKLKQRPGFGKGKVRWEWRTFTNGARKDGLKLKHWEKVKEDPSSEYPFSKYYTQTPIYSYTAEEYEGLQDEEWSKEETDYLFSLVKEYDMRWYVIADRYEFPGGPERAIEDLKARYFSVCRKLIRARPWTGEEAAKTALLNSYQFDKERERTRKTYVASLFARTPEQIAEEDALYLEIKRLEQTERRFAKEREELMKTVAGIESGLNVHQPDEAAFSGLFIDPRKKKKRGDGTDGDSPSAGSLTGPVQRVINAKQAAADMANCITRVDTASTTAPSTKTAHVPAHLRSTKLPYPKSSIAPKVTALLGELGVSTTRLVMPTQGNIQRLESLIESASQLIELKKAADRMDQEIRTQKKLLGLIEEEGEEEEAALGAGIEKTGSEPVVQASGASDVMEVDREESVAVPDGTSEGALNQRQNRKRSLSISSVETAATGVTRASRSNKRTRKS